MALCSPESLEVRGIICSTSRLRFRGKPLLLRSLGKFGLDRKQTVGQATAMLTRAMRLCAMSLAWWAVFWPSEAIFSNVRDGLSACNRNRNRKCFWHRKEQSQRIPAYRERAQKRVFNRRDQSQLLATSQSQQRITTNFSKEKSLAIAHCQGGLTAAIAITESGALKRGLSGLNYAHAKRHVF